MHVGDAHSDDITKSDGYASTKSDGYASPEHYVLELDDLAPGGDAGSHLASHPIPFVLAINSASSGDL